MYMSLKVHNILDYVAALFYFVAPFVFGFGDVVAAKNLFVTMGLVMMLSGLLTSNYYSLGRIIPLGVHLWMDVGVGMLIYLGPYFFGYLSDLTPPQFFLHILVGVFSVSHVVYTNVREEEWKFSHEGRFLAKRREA